MPSRKGSSRRKPAVIRHITKEEDDSVSDDLPEIRLDPSSDADVSAVDDAETGSPAADDAESASPATEMMEDVVEEGGSNEEGDPGDDSAVVVLSDGDEDKMTNGDGEEVQITTDEKGNEVLPDGTLVLQPAEVSENDDFSGPEFRKRTAKKTVNTPEMEGTYKCTSCHEQLNPNNPRQVFKHALLGVLLCRQCNKYLVTGKFDIDDEGSEDQCRWCGEGGNLICCDDCPKAFCRSCIKANLGRKEMRAILDSNEDDKWLCYVCNPEPLSGLQEECQQVMYYMKKQKEAKDIKVKPEVVAKAKKARGRPTKQEGDEKQEHDLLRVMQLMGDKSASKQIVDNLVKGRSPKGLRETLSLFNNIRKISEVLEHRIRDELNDDEVVDDKSATRDTKSDKKEASVKKDTDSSQEDDEDTGSDKPKKKKSHKKIDESADDDVSENDGKKSPRRLKTTKKGKHDKTADSSPSEDDIPGTSNGYVKGNKSGRKGRRSLFKAQQKEKEKTVSSSSEDSDEEDGSESGTDSDWEEDAGVKERRLARASRKGKAGGKLAAKKGKGDLSSDDSDSDDKDKKSRKKNKKSKDGSDDSDDSDLDDKDKKRRKKKKKSKDGSDDSEIDFPKSDQKKKKKKRGPGVDSSNVESTEDDSDKKKKNKKKTIKKSKDGDISLSSSSNEEQESDSGDSSDSAAEVRRKIKKAKQNSEKGTKENKAALESDTEDKIAERLLMEELEDEENNASETSDSDLDDAKKKRDKRNKKDRKRKKDSDEEGDDKEEENDKKSTKKKRKKGSSDEAEDETDKEEEEGEKKRRKVKKVSKKSKKDSSDEESDETEEEEGKKDKKSKNKKASKKKKKHHLLEVKISESESEEDTKKKKGKPTKKKRKKKKKEDSDDLMTSAESSTSSSSESDVKPKKRKRRKKGDESSEDNVKRGRSYEKKKGKRRRIKVAASSDSNQSENKSGSGSDTVKEVSGSESGSNKEEDTPGKHRKKIRRVLKKSKLQETTVKAEVAEKERRERINARRKELMGEEETPKIVEKFKELVLEYGKDKTEHIVEVDKEIVKHLKPHQVEGVQFMWDSTFESIEKKDEAGGGCILAHCMGLGKTLQVITYLHTLMTHDDMDVKRCLVVAPLNTVLNWVDEFNKWLSHDDSIDVYEITSIKNNDGRADMLEQWHEEGGVLVMGYSMYRILTYNSKLKKKRLKRIFHATLVDPGPDIVVCDEGHMLKNSQTAIAKALNSCKSKRRVCLTGTPLQNNLVEYHCMVDFVKPNLLGTCKEYKNRFVNPITNGQCSDSTGRDVRVMKHRAHILHDLLAGCVQRKDYNVITKFLPPKHEYVLSIRLSPEQIKLYEVYLGQQSDMKREDGAPHIQQRSTSIFADYQSLMRIWTHPQVLKLNTIREENKAANNFDDFITSEEDSDGTSIDDFLDDRDSSECEVAPIKITKSNSSRATRSTRSTRNSQATAAQNGDDSSSDNDDEDLKNGKGEDDDKDGGHRSDSSLEIIQSWKTRSRTVDPENDNVAQNNRFPDPPSTRKEWYSDYFDPEKDAYNLQLSGKLLLLFEILRHCETIGEKVLVFSQSLLSLDLIEDFLEHLNKQAEEARDKGEQELDKQIAGAGAWIKGEDYFRMDGSTGAAYRHSWCDIFNDVENIRARLFLISTKAGSLGINLVGANRVIIFDASWNPSHDTQSIFRVYRFGQTRAVFIYRFVAQGTMEEKIYERQVAKQSLSQRVVDEHQIERHFSAGQLSELYNFTPDRLDDPDRKEPPIPQLPKDHILADLLDNHKEWIYKYHEHDSLLENKIDEELSEEDRKAAWDEYNAEKEGRLTYGQNPGWANMVQDYQGGSTGQGNMSNMLLQRLYNDGRSVLQTGQNILGGNQQQFTQVTINGVKYNVPSNQVNNQALLMRQYQALQQQQQRNYVLMAQQQQREQQQKQQQQQSHQGLAANQLQRLMSGSYAGGAGGAPASQGPTMSSLLSQMSRKAANPTPVSITSAYQGGGAAPTTQLYNTLKRQAEAAKAAQQKSSQQENGSAAGGSADGGSGAK